MDLLTAIVLGVIQGITEWIPISSEAMVTLTGRFFFNMSYSEAIGNALWLHGGTMLAAVVYFRKDIYEILMSVFKGDRSILIFLIIATFFSCLIAGVLILFLFSIQINDAYFTLLIGFCLLILSFLYKNKKLNQIDKKINNKNAILPGILQGFAVIPGVSRSGVTIVSLIYEKFSLKQAFRFSFLMSIPVTFLASIMVPFIKQDFIFSNNLLISGITAFIVGLLTIKTLMDLAEKINFYKATLTLSIFILLLGIIQVLF